MLQPRWLITSSTLVNDRHMAGVMMVIWAVVAVVHHAMMPGHNHGFSVGAGGVEGSEAGEGEAEGEEDFHVGLVDDR